MEPVVVMDLYLHPEAVALLSSKCRIVRCKAGTEGVKTARNENAAAAVLGPTWQFTGSVLDQIPSLLVIGRPGIGVDSIDLDAATERGVAVVNTPDAPTTSTAEHAVAMLLALAKRHRAAARLLTSGGLFTEEPTLIEVKGKTLGLVGLGRVGKRMAHICGAGLGMKVIAFDPYVSADQAAELGVTLYPDLYDVLRAADFVSLHCPPSKNTRRMINAEALVAMKPTSYLINCARGSIVDEGALVEALRAGKIAGAGLDVFDPEPPSPSNPLLTMENVVATPHTAGFTDDCLRAMGLGVAKEVLDVLSGVRPSNLVNPNVWDSPARRQQPKGRPE
jgi:D-3-phosphoglycerate dehydrogenase